MLWSCHHIASSVLPEKRCLVLDDGWFWRGAAPGETPKTTKPPAKAGGLRQRNDRSAALQRLDQLGHDLVNVTHDAEVRNGENRRLWVLVDRDDVL